jgi:hypothetical protein
MSNENRLNPGMRKQKSKKPLNMAINPANIGTVVLLSLFFLTITVSAARASTEAATPGKVYLLLIDKLSINDIDESSTPNMYQLIEQGAVGLCSTRTLTGYNTMNTYLTIGAGNLAKSNKTGLMAFNKDESVPGQHQYAARFYANITGWDAGESECLMVNLPDILLGMKNESVTTVPGNLGQILVDNGYRVAVLGNADNGTEHLRPVLAVGMDKKGQVLHGDIGPLTRLIPEDSILSYKTNYQYLKERSRDFSNQVDLLIIDLPDLSRLENSPLTFDEIYQQEKKNILKEIDSFTAWLNSSLDPSRDLLLIVAPSCSRAEIARKNNFAPVIASGYGIKSGYLTSPATQRQYIVANTDIAPTILDFFQIKNADNSMIGRAIHSIGVDEESTLERAQQLAHSTSTTTRLRTPLIKGYVGSLIIILLLASIIILKYRSYQFLLKPVIIAMVSFPLVLLFLGLLRLPHDYLYIFVAIVATIIITILALALSRGNGFRAFIALSFITLWAINLDVLTGTTLIQCSVLGYDPMAGARYYGIGNEYMGILLGASIATGAALFEKYKHKWILFLLALFFLFECYLIGMPSLGAQSDGMITAPLAFLVSLYLFSEIRLNLLGWSSIGAIILFTILGVSFYDMSRPTELQSHIGRAAHQIISGGWQEALTIIIRKFQVNVKLIKYTIWSRVFIVILLVLATFIYFPVGAMKNLLVRRPVILKGFVGIVTAALVALIVNDSGIVAASTTSIYLIMPFLLLMMEEESSRL